MREFENLPCGACITGMSGQEPREFGAAGKVTLHRSCRNDYFYAGSSAVRDTRPFHAQKVILARDSSESKSPNPKP